MITDDEVMRLFERADPARVDDAAAVADPAVYLAALRTRSSNVTLIETEPTPTRPPNRHRGPILAAAAAVVAIVVGGLVLATRDDDADEPQVPAGPSTVAPDTAAAEAEQVARAFIEAENAYDADRALTSFSQAAIAAQFGTREQYRLDMAFSEAISVQALNIDCQEQSESADGIVVRCTYDHHSLRSDEIGLGPYSGDYKDLTIRDGAIVAVETHLAFGTNNFSNEMWVPFRIWVATEHPDDVLKMYEDAGQTEQRITEESIPLWEQRTQEYVQAVLTGRETYPADVGAICATQAARLGELAIPAEIGPETAAAWRSTAAIMEQAHGELTALAKPPATDTMTYTSFYGQLIRLVRIAQESAEASTAGDSTRLAELTAEYFEVRRGMSSGPTGSGLEDCVASPPG